MSNDLNIQIVHCDHENTVVPEDFPFSVENAKKARKFHESFPGYKITPLVSLKELAKLLGVNSIYVKDESYRFGLNAFKVLGGSYAIGRFIAQKTGISPNELTFSRLTGSEMHNELGNITFVTATDGNHGRGVAWTAKQLGQKCVVYMPKGSAPERLENIRALGAQASITEFNYDDSVRLAAEYAYEHDGVLIQDTTVPGYEDVPVHIMQGYATMIDEAIDQLQGEIPTHVFLQAGVGAMAGSVTGYLAAKFGNKRPVITIVEPNEADCIYKTAKAADGKIHTVKGSLSTMMAGLACGEPCTVGWNVLKNYADNFISMPDDVAAIGMRVLGAPLPGDDRVISGESGAAGFGLAVAALLHKEQAALKKQLGLDENSRILCISTEGATDRVNYRRVVWGKCED